MYLSNRKPDCRPYTPGLPNLLQPEDLDMAGWHITTPAAAWNHGRFEDYSWLHSANWTICVTKRTRRRRRLYADDTTLNSTLDCFGNGDEEIQIFLTTELQKIFKWLDVNKLCLNTAKSKYMLFHMPQKILPELSFSFNGIPIKNVHV